MIIKILLTLFFFILILYIAASLFFVHFITKPVCETVPQNIEKEKSQGFWGNYDSYPKEIWNITASDGYLLHGIWLKNRGEKFVIITHGYTATKYGSVKYANMFYELGYDVYFYDIRHHGENEKYYCSMGYNESRDIVDIAQAIRTRFGQNISIGLHGESLGCASTLIALGIDNKFDFFIADCGFSDLQSLMEYQAKVRFNLPKILARGASDCNYLIHGYRFFDIRPKDSLANNKVPILFIHGGKDNFIPPRMCHEMYEMATSKKEIHIVADAWHAQSYHVNPDSYCNMVKAFLESIS